MDGGCWWIYSTEHLAQRHTMPACLYPTARAAYTPVNGCYTARRGRNTARRTYAHALPLPSQAHWYRLRARARCSFACLPRMPLGTLILRARCHRLPACPCLRIVLPAVRVPLSRAPLLILNIRRRCLSTHAIHLTLPLPSAAYLRVCPCRAAYTSHPGWFVYHRLCLPPACPPPPATLPYRHHLPQRSTRTAATAYRCRHALLYCYPLPHCRVNLPPYRRSCLPRSLGRVVILRGVYCCACSVPALLPARALRAAPRRLPTPHAPHLHLPAVSTI